MLRAIFIVLCLLSTSSSVHAQFVIEGRTIDKQHIAVPFATAVLHLLEDSTVIKTEMADSAGNFRITTAAVAGDTYLEIMAQGYATQTRIISHTSVFPVKPEFILEATAHELNSITIFSKKPLIERKIDRTIFNVESSVSATGSDAYDLLAKAPGVRTSNGEISLAGKSTVSVMLNDRLIKLSGDELETMLRSIAGDNIARIEVITTPPARYDAEGNSGIINIVTKKHTKDGFNGNITATWEQRVRPSQQANGAFNFRKGKVNIFGNGNSNWFRFTSLQEVITFYPTRRQEQHLDQRSDPFINRYEVGMDYNITKNSIIGFLYTIGSTDRGLSQSYVTNVFQLPATTLDSALYTSAYMREKALRNVGNLNYEWKIDSMGKKLNIDIDYFTRTNRNTRDFTTWTLSGDGNPAGNAGDNKTRGGQTLDIRSAKLDVTWPTHKMEITYGAKLSAIHNTSDNTFAYLQGTQYVTDLAKTNRFDYRESTQAVYASAGKHFGKWQLQAGLRAEYTQTKGISLTLNQTNTNDYFKLFPTAYVQYTRNEDHVVNLNYSRRIERPEFQMLDPFRKYSTGNSFEGGNPFLQPAFVHGIDLTYTLKQAYSFGFFANLVQNDFSNLVFTDTALHTFSLVPVNAGTFNSYGLAVNATLSPFDWWVCNTSVYGYNIAFRSADKSTRYIRPVLSIESDNSFTLNASKTWMAELGFDYKTAALNDYMLQGANGNVWAGIKTLLLQKQLTLALNVEDIFRTDKSNSRNLQNGTIRWDYYDNRLLNLSATWKFGKRNIKDKREHSAGAEEAQRAK